MDNVTINRVGTADERDEKLSELISLTGSDPGLARDLLEGSQWNVGVALSAFTTLTTVPPNSVDGPGMASRPCPVPNDDGNFRAWPPEITEHPDYSYHHGPPIEFRANNILDHLEEPEPPKVRSGFRSFDLNLDPGPGSGPLRTLFTGERLPPRSRDRLPLPTDHAHAPRQSPQVRVIRPGPPLDQGLNDVSSFEGIERKIRELRRDIVPRSPPIPARPLAHNRPQTGPENGKGLTDGPSYFPFYLPNVWTEFFVEPQKAGERHGFLKFFQESILDRSVSRKLESSGKLNWWLREPGTTEFATSRLYALSTSGDGNCLLHAASLGIWGFNDKSLTLRNALYQTLVDDRPSHVTRGGPLWRRWRLRQSISNQQCGLVLNDREWEEEWAGLVDRASPFATNCTRRNEPAAIKMAISYDNAIQHRPISLKQEALANGPTESRSCDVIDRLDRRRSSILTESTAESYERFPNILPIYQSLEEFHIYVLANVLRRPIIVLSQSVLRDMEGEPLSPISFGGIYLPLEHPAPSCRKSPLLLAYEASHFSPLVVMAAPCDQLVNERLAQEQADVTVLLGESQVPLSDETIENGQRLLYYPVDIPLVDSNLEPLPIHFAIDPGPQTDWDRLPVLSRQSSLLRPPRAEQGGSGSSPSTSSRDNYCGQWDGPGDARGYLSDPPPSGPRKSSRSIWHRPAQSRDTTGTDSLALTSDQYRSLLERYLEVRYANFESDGKSGRNRRKSSTSGRRSSSCSRRGAEATDGENDWRGNTGIKAALKWPKRGEARSVSVLTRPMVVIRVYYKTASGRYTDRVDRFARKMLDRFRTKVTRPVLGQPNGPSAKPALHNNLVAGYELSTDFLRAPSAHPKFTLVPTSGSSEPLQRDRANTFDKLGSNRKPPEPGKPDRPDRPSPDKVFSSDLPNDRERKRRSRSHHRYLVDKLSSKSVGALNELMNSMVGRGLLQKTAPSPPTKPRSSTAKFYEPTPVSTGGNGIRQPPSAHSYGRQNVNNNNSNHCLDLVPCPEVLVTHDHVISIDQSNRSPPNVGGNAVRYSSALSTTSSSSVDDVNNNNNNNNNDTKCKFGACLLAQWIQHQTKTKGCNPRGLLTGFRRPDPPRDISLRHDLDPYVVGPEMVHPRSNGGALKVAHASFHNISKAFSSTRYYVNGSTPDAANHDDWRDNTECADTRRYRLLAVKKLPESLSSDADHRPDYNGIAIDNRKKLFNTFAP